MYYTPEEYTDMIICYGLAGENGNGAVRIYAQRFPNRKRHPTRTTIAETIRRLRETGSVLNRKQSGSIPRHSISDEEKVLRMHEEDPKSSVRSIANALGLPSSKVHNILQQDGTTRSSDEDEDDD